MRIDDIQLTKSAAMPGHYHLRIESFGYKADLFFEPKLTHLMEAVADAIKFFGQAHGVLEKQKDGTYKNVRKA